MRIPLALLVLVAAACSSSPSRDGGPETDAGVLTDAGDGGPETDAGVHSDAGASDGGRDTDAEVHSDAGDGDGGAAACDPSAVFIPTGGSLRVGQLCDDLYVCVVDEPAALAVMAASARFVCSATPEGSCAGWTCAYRDPGGPSTLDATELAEICKVTVLVPQPAMTCMVYL